MQKAWARTQDQKGFTIVELLIVIVVIGILAAITVIAYGGIQSRSHDAAVQTDLRNIGSQVNQFLATEGRLPTLAADFTSLRMKVAGNSYGSPYVSGGLNYNLAYCYNTTNSTFALVAGIKSGNVFVFNGGARQGIGPMTTILTTCSNNGFSTTTAAWFYSGSAWQHGIQP